MVQVWALTLHPFGSPWQLLPLGCLALLVWAQVRLERNRRHLAKLEAWMSSEGARPQGARVVHPNGSTTPLELVYAGCEDGVHVWEGVAQVEPGDKLAVDVLPPRTAIRLPASHAWGDGMDWGFDA